MAIKRWVPVLLVIVSLCVPAGLSRADGLPDVKALITADEVMGHLYALSMTIGARPMGSQAEADGLQYVADILGEYGYLVTWQEFETTPPGEDAQPVQSGNVVGVLPGDEQILVIGAHVDSVTDGTGAGDNASGVAAVLAAARVLAEADLTHTVMIVGFGAEEGGDPSGATVFVEQLGDDIANVIAMINVDSVGVGTTLNVYAGAEITWPEEEGAAPEIVGGPTWVRDTALDLAAELELPFSTSPEDTWGGFTGDWSDHYAFVLAGVPIVYFEAWQWAPAEDPWWGQETAEGDVMHTEGDIFENVVPEKVEMSGELIAATAYVIAAGMVQGSRG